MIKDPGMKSDLARMTGIEDRITGEIVRDYELIFSLKRGLGSKDVYRRDRAVLGLSYLLLFYPSPLVRHEAAFVLGEYGKGPAHFLRASALLDSDATVRHEATLALSAPSQRSYAGRSRSLISYIAKKDRSKMVRDTARVALARLEFYD